MHMQALPVALSVVWIYRDLQMAGLLEGVLSSRSWTPGPHAVGRIDSTVPKRLSVDYFSRSPWTTEEDGVSHLTENLK